MKYSYYNSTESFKLQRKFNLSSFEERVKLNQENVDIERFLPEDLKKHIHNFSSLSVYAHKTKPYTKVIVQIAPYNKSYFIYYSDDSFAKLHRDNGPAFVEFNNYDYMPLLVQYFKNGIAHRDNKPQELSYYLSGNLRTIVYKNNGLLHRINKPAVTSFWLVKVNGQIIKQHESYFINGKRKRNNDKPLVVWYDGKGDVSAEFWYDENDSFTRLNGPARITYIQSPIQEDKKIKKEWFVNNKRLDLRVFPAFENGKKINRVRLTKSVIMGAMMFDRDYGNFLKKMYESTNQ